MRPDSHKQLPNNCLCSILFLILWRCRFSRVFLYHWRSLFVYRAPRTFFPSFFFFFFSSFHLTYSRWASSLPSCLWSQRIFPSLPGSRLTIFLSRCKFSTLTTRQPMVEFYLLTFPRFLLRKKEHKSYFGKNRTHDFRTSRCAAYLLDHSGRMVFFYFVTTGWFLTSAFRKIRSNPKLQPIKNDSYKRKKKIPCLKSSSLASRTWSKYVN